MIIYNLASQTDCIAFIYLEIETDEYYLITAKPMDRTCIGDLIK